MSWKCRSFVSLVNPRSCTCKGWNSTHRHENEESIPEEGPEHRVRQGYHPILSTGDPGSCEDAGEDTDGAAHFGLKRLHWGEISGIQLRNVLIGSRSSNGPLTLKLWFCCKGCGGNNERMASLT